MSDKQRRKRWKIALTLVTLAALAGTAYAVRGQIAETIQNFGKVNTWALLLVVPLEAFNYYGQAKLYQGLFAILGDRFRTKSLYRLALELNLVNNIFPSGGVSGFSYLSYRMREEKVSTAKATLVQMMKFIMVFVSFQILLFIGLIMLAIGDKANSLILLVAGSLSTLLFVGTVGIAFVIGSKSRINSFFTLVTRLLNRIIYVFRRNHPETINITKARETFTELHENYMHIRRNLGALKKPLMFSLLANVTEIAAIYVVYIAFGHLVNPGAVVLAYAIANFAGLVSVLPGGIGIYEALMTGVMTAGGVPISVSLPVTVMFRIVSMAVQLPVGYYFYQKALHAEPKLEDVVEAIKHEDS
ncbi:MAG: lysylphosphatidylglycerol synthase transmembrane domain-containing protein [Patescibacteria group bacterium]